MAVIGINDVPVRVRTTSQAFGIKKVVVDIFGGRLSLYTKRDVDRLVKLLEEKKGVLPA